MADDGVPFLLNDVLQVPLHQMGVKFRSHQKNYEQGANSVLKAVKDLAQKAAAKEATGESVAPDKAVAALERIEAKLRELKEQVLMSSVEMQSSLESLTFRLAMRNGAVVPDARDSKRARATKTPISDSSDRMLEIAVISNYLLRNNRFDTYRVYCEETGCEFLNQDAEMFRNHADTVSALREKHDGEPALAWCQENRSVLRKRQSSLEFDVRLRQFLSIVGKGDAIEAVYFARKHLAANALDERTRKAVATLIYPTRALSTSPYASLLDEERWEDLANQFFEERNGAIGLNSVAPLEMLVKIGLAVTRTTTCRPDGPGKAAGCPACQPNLGKLALSIPRTLRERSSLVCRITGLVMEDPLVLPNGQAYSKDALEQMAQSRGDGKVQCPVTNQEFYLKDCRRAFIL